MKTSYLLLSFLILSGLVHAEEKRVAMPFTLYKTETAPAELTEDEALFVFEFRGLQDEEKHAEITLSIDDGDNETIQLTKGNLEYKTTPGKHKFIVYINDDYYELYSHELVINAQEKQYYAVYPRRNYGIIETVDKPVIYLYPEESSAFEVVVNPVGEMSFTYPEYEAGWEGTMHPNGSLDIKGENYRYLFWESQQRTKAMNPLVTPGFVVDRENVVSFLEEKLNAVGFTASERADFITYWGPKMQQETQVFVTFHQDSACDAYATLEITPKPDNLHRFYMSWGAYEGNENPAPQKLTSFNRSGFTAIEWGGQKVPTISHNL